MLDLKKKQREQFVKKVTGMAAALGFKVSNTLLYWTTTCACYIILQLYIYWATHNTNLAMYTTHEKKKKNDVSDKLQLMANHVQFLRAKQLSTFTNT